VPPSLTSRPRPLPSHLTQLMATKNALLQGAFSPTSGIVTPRRPGRRGGAVTPARHDGSRDYLASAPSRVESVPEKRAVAGAGATIKSRRPHQASKPGAKSGLRNGSISQRRADSLPAGRSSTVVLADSASFMELFSGDFVQGAAADHGRPAPIERRGSKIRFSDDVVTHDVLSHTDMPKSMHGSLWYQRRYVSPSACASSPWWCGCRRALLRPLTSSPQANGTTWSSATSRSCGLRSPGMTLCGGG